MNAEEDFYIDQLQYIQECYQREAAPIIAKIARIRAMSAPPPIVLLRADIDIQNITLDNITKLLNDGTICISSIG